ncbi:DUF6538 domain-containing protein [Aureimonas jatrophae]|uniref:Site-specific recombinase XerD n=1 Tax=Aureimonas jatrophae TaxID=1166073 RepID=A0A1H0ITJ4_9HYPH|nr:DUF6538 domain-containing protein [Aureimonas jatrophae]MBB3952352.1 integrase [Aureimonas jatrophae]SDO34692.1 Site-specific recombinase XerD [Aureimonas jatrophae]
MVLAMSRPQKHPRTGVYWFRMRVPADLVAAVGRKEITRSLETKDPSEARLRHAQLRSEYDAYWANLRAGPRTLTEREAHELAEPFYDDWLGKHEQNPSQQTFWDTRVGARLWSRDAVNADPVPDWVTAPVDGYALTSVQFLRHASLERWCREQATSFLAGRGLVTSNDSRDAMARAIGAAVQRASLILEQEARGDYAARGHRPSPTALTHTATPNSVGATGGSPRAAKGQPSVSLSGLVDDWWQEAKATGRKPSTYESYRNAFATLIKFLGHDDATQVGKADVIAFKDHRLATPSARTGRVPSAKTVKDSDLTALKAVFEWGVVNGRMAENPATNVTIRLGKPRKLRDKGFTDAEAIAILQAASTFELGRENARTGAAKRWVPWLCAFTGARLGEIAQLRKEDVTQRDGHWVVRITPEAGTVKTNEAREVVLHYQLQQLGFPTFIEQAPKGHLFITVGKEGDVLGPLQGLKNRLSAFVRTVVTDPNVAPFHGWRHRFKTVGMEVGIPPRVLDAIQGHAPRSVSDSYGQVTLRTMAQEIEKLPPFKLEG